MDNRKFKNPFQNIKNKTPFLNDSKKDDQDNSLKKEESIVKTNEKPPEEKEEKKLINETNEELPSLVTYIISVTVALLVNVIYLLCKALIKVPSAESVEVFKEYNRIEEDLSVSKEIYLQVERVADILNGSDYESYSGIDFLTNLALHFLFLIIINPFVFALVKKKKKGFWKSFFRFHFPSLLSSIFWLLFLLISTYLILSKEVFVKLFNIFFKEITFCKYSDLRVVKEVNNYSDKIVKKFVNNELHGTEHVYFIGGENLVKVK